MEKSLLSVMDDTIGMGKQMLVFVSSRSSAQKEARELSSHLKTRLENGDLGLAESVVESWTSMSQELWRGEDGSATVKALSNSVRGGVGFHHAGLTSSQRKDREWIQEWKSPV